MHLNLKQKVLIFILSIFINSGSGNAGKRINVTHNKTSITRTDDSSHKATYSIIEKLNQRKIDHSFVSEKPLKIIILKEREKNTISIFTYILPIVTLLLGILINKCLDYWSNTQRRKKAGKRWIAELASLEAPIKEQVNALTDFVGLHNNETYTLPDLRIFTILNCETIKNLDKSELIDYIEKTLKKEFNDAVAISNKIHGQISVLTSLHDILKDKFDLYSKGSSSLTDSLSDNLNSLCRASAEFFVILEKSGIKNPLNDPTYKPISDLFSEYIFPKMQKGDYDIFVLEKEFFTPLLEILAQLRHDDRIEPMKNFTSQCMSDLKGIKMERIYLNQSISTVIKTYNNQLGDLDLNLKNIMPSRSQHLVNLSPPLAGV